MSPIQIFLKHCPSKVKWSPKLERVPGNHLSSEVKGLLWGKIFLASDLWRLPLIYNVNSFIIENSFHYISLTIHFRFPKASFTVKLLSWFITLLLIIGQHFTDILIFVIKTVFDVLIKIIQIILLKIYKLLVN